MIGLLTLWIVTIIIFAAIELLPGDIATEMLGQAATEESLAAFREKFDLNRPVHERYFSWLGGAVTGDFGISLANQRPISELIGHRTANTFFLAGYAAAIAVPIAVVSGMLAALYNGSIFDRVLSSSTLAAISFPEFFVAYILIGLLFTIEFVTRKLIFRQFGSGLPDRLLAWLLGHRYPAPTGPATDGHPSTPSHDLRQP